MIGCLFNNFTSIVNNSSFVGFLRVCGHWEALSLLSLSCYSSVSLFSNGQLHTFTTGQGNPGLVTFADNKHIRQPCSKAVTQGILDVHNVERARMSLPLSDGAHTSQVMASSDHHKVARVPM